jgi:hypothetical protein
MIEGVDDGGREGMTDGSVEGKNEEEGVNVGGREVGV